MKSHTVLIALILLVVWAPTKEEAYTSLQSREDTLDIDIQIHGCEIYLPFTVPTIFISYMPIEEANSRVTITIEIWHLGKVVENYTHRNYFWHKNQWASLGPIQPRLGIGLNRLVVRARALQRIDKKVELALTEAAETNRLEIRKLDKVNGILTAYSPAYNVPVVVSLSKANGLNVWYLYERDCSECNQRLKCRELLLNEAKERGIKLDEGDSIPPTMLALEIFSKYLEEENDG